MNTPEDFAKSNHGITPSSFGNGWLQEIELIVPLYQRLFVWEEEQIDQLLQDLARAYLTNKDSPYYIGTLTVFRNRERQSAWELVDGQQRITVLTLLGIACSHEWGKGLWDPFLRNHGACRLRYFARRNDEDDLKALMEKFDAGRITNANMKRFVELFSRFLHDLPQTFGEGFSGADFSKFVFEKTTALMAFLPDTYGLNDLNFYFEKMNSAGKQLEAHEILKGRYFGCFSERWNAVADGSKAYDGPRNANSAGGDCITLEKLLNERGTTSYKHEEEPAESAYLSDSARLVMSFPVFLLHVLSICLGSDEEKPPEGLWEPSNLLETFKQWWERNDKNENVAEAFVREMEKYRWWIDRWIIHIEDDRPVPPYADETVEEAFQNPLWQFQSMLFVSSGEQQRWVMDAYKSFKEESRESFFESLKRQDKQRHQFKEVGGWSYGQIDRYWFWKLDYILWELLKQGDLPPEPALDDDERKAIEAYTFRRNRSIEHLHPQRSDKPWEGEDLHSFGNLAMISASFNSQQSNDSVGAKFGRLRDKIRAKELESIKLLLMFKQANGMDDQWRQDTAKKHRDEMMVILSDYYNAGSDQGGCSTSRPATSEANSTTENPI